MGDIALRQAEICKKYGVSPYETEPTSKLGIARNVEQGVIPVNGLRIEPEGDTCGWYIWAGTEMSADADFFVPLHVGHLQTWYPSILVYLGLPPGWRFLIAPDYEDVWFDPGLLRARL